MSGKPRAASWALCLPVQSISKSAKVYRKFRGCGPRIRPQKVNEMHWLGLEPGKGNDRQKNEIDRPNVTSYELYLLIAIKWVVLQYVVER